MRAIIDLSALSTAAGYASYRGCGVHQREPIGRVEFGARFNLTEFAEQSRRDDLEGVGYMLLYLFNGSLPWTKYLDDEQMEEYCRRMKNNITVKELCDGLPGS